MHFTLNFSGHSGLESLTILTVNGAEYWLPLENKTGDDFLMKSLPAKTAKERNLSNPASESYVSLQGAKCLLGKVQIAIGNLCCIKIILMKFNINSNHVIVLIL